MIEMLSTAVMLVIAAGMSVVLILIAIDIALFSRLRSRIPQKPLSEPENDADTYKPLSTDVGENPLV